MAVYKRRFNPYGGERTPSWGRFLIIPRFAYSDVFSSRIVLAFFVACFIWPLLCAAFIYIRYNATFLETFGLQLSDFGGILAVDAEFFLRFLYAQGLLSFFLTILVGPGLVSADLANNALPLYLSRPFSRSEYIIGKMAVLLILLSAITWVPGLVLIGLQTALGGLGWLQQEWSVGPALFIGSWLWILTLSLLSLAISAWVRWKPVAAAALFGVFFILPGMGELLNVTLGVSFGDAFHLVVVFFTIWSELFGVPFSGHLTLTEAWLALFVFYGLCLLILNRKLRAYEVVS